MVRLTWHILFTLCSGVLTAQTPVIELPQPAKFNVVRSGAFQAPTHKVQLPASVPRNYPGSILDQYDQSRLERDRRIREEVDRYIENQRKQREALDKALIETGLNKPVISYELRGPAIPGRERYYTAYDELAGMIAGTIQPNLKRAVFLYENAFDPSLDWNWYQNSIDKMVRHIGAVMQSQDINKNDPVSMNMALFRFFTDTLSVELPGTERLSTSYPLFYDFEDYWGHEDLHKQFVSKLMRNGTGQCHSLPLLYLILAEELGIDAHLAFSPSHSYIKFQDGIGNWHNIELTNHALTSDQFVTYSGYIKSEAMMNRVYMHPLSKKDVVAQTVMDLAGAYVRQFGYEKFVANCTGLAIDAGLKSMSVPQYHFNYHLTLLRHVLKQYREYGLTDADFRKDKNAMLIYSQVVGAEKHIENQGYVDMPADQYERWLGSVQEESRKQEHRNKLRQLTGQIE